MVTDILIMTTEIKPITVSPSASKIVIKYILDKALHNYSGTDKAVSLPLVEFACNDNYSPITEQLFWVVHEQILKNHLASSIVPLPVENFVLYDGAIRSVVQSEHRQALLSAMVKYAVNQYINPELNEPEYFDKAKEGYTDNNQLECDIAFFKRNLHTLESHTPLLDRVREVSDGYHFDNKTNTWSEISIDDWIEEDTEWD